MLNRNLEAENKNMCKQKKTDICKLLLKNRKPNYNNKNKCDIYKDSYSPAMSTLHAIQKEVENNKQNNKNNKITNKHKRTGAQIAASQ